MKYILITLLTGASLVAQSQIAVSISLDQAIAYAASNSPSFKNTAIDKSIAKAKSLEAKAKYIPKLNGTVDFRDNLKQGELAFPANRFNPSAPENEVIRIQTGTQYTATAGADLTIPVLDMGTIAEIKYSDQAQQLSALQQQQAMIDLKMTVSRAYYAALLNEERSAKAAKSVQRYENAYKDAKTKFDNQNALKAEVSRAYLNLSNAKFQLSAARDSVSTARANLLQLIGAPEEATLVLTDALPTQTLADTALAYSDVKMAEQQRIEFKTENVQRALNKQQLQRIHFQYLPTVTGYGYIGGQGMDNENIFGKDKWFWNSYIGLRMNLPLFDGLQKVALAQQSKLAMQKNENNLRTLRLQVNYQLQTSAAKLASAARNLSLLRDNVALAEDLVKDATTRYNNSVATYQELLDAENTLKETEFNYLASLFDYLMSELEWKRANGRL